MRKAVGEKHAHSVAQRLRRKHCRNGARRFKLETMCGTVPYNLSRISATYLEYQQSGLERSIRESGRSTAREANSSSSSPREARGTR